MSNLTLSLLLDQLGGGVGGARFTSEYVRALINSHAIMQRINEVFLVCTQSESTAELGPIPQNAKIVRRRIPSRIRGTGYETLIQYLLPQVDVAHGLFYYVFPGQGRRSVITVHDLSVFHPEFHLAEKRGRQVALLENQLAKCDRVVVDTESIRQEFLERWPAYADRCALIHMGVALPPTTLAVQASRVSPEDDKPYILAVGTIEPRKNYDRLLDAYQLLRSELGSEAPLLVVIGRKGWMAEKPAQRLAALDGQGYIRWLSSVNDAELLRYYRHAAVFTYVSLYEGWGLPPFEAALAGIPLVLSEVSSVGELWAGYAHCVDPLNVEAIAAGWRWALSLSSAERKGVVEQQRRAVEKFPWSRCVSAYLDLYEAMG